MSTETYSTRSSTKPNLIFQRFNASLRMGLAAFLFIVVLVFVGLYQLRPPQVVPANAPLTEFSAERALQYVTAIAEGPHPVGSLALAQNRDYIISQFKALGLEVQAQDATPLLSLTDLPIAASYGVTGNIHNILARLKGTDSTKAVVIAGHYDSVSASPNVSDGGSTVLTALETARALKAGAPLKNDVFFLLTDAEENEMLGAQAFIDQHPWAKDVGIMLYFVARGTSGPSIMFETSSQNGWLIQEFAKVAPHPIANSLSYSVYRMLPNATEFTMYKNAGIAGLNFAYIDNPGYYHTKLDNVENMDLGSLQHHGAYALALTQHFGNLDLRSTQNPDDVYFDIWGLTMVYYPVSWTTALLVLVALVYVGVMGWGLKSKRLSVRGIGAGILALFLSVIATLIVVALIAQLALALHSEYRLVFLGHLYNAPYYLVAFAALALAITSTLYIIFCKRVRVQDLIAGALSVWFGLALVSGFYLPGGSYLFIFPLLFSLLALGTAFFWKKAEPLSWHSLAMFSLGAAPALILIVPVIYLLYVALAPLSTGGLATAGIVVLVLGLLIPHLTLITKAKAWLLPGTAGVVAIGFLAMGSLTAGFTPERPKPNSIFYGLNATTEKAVWLSTDRQLDTWTSQFFTQGAELAVPNEYFLFRTAKDHLIGPAPVAPVPAPQIQVLDDTVNNGTRQLRLAYSSPTPQKIVNLNIAVEPNTVLTANLKGALGDLKIRPSDRWLSFAYFGYYPADQKTLELSLAITPAQSIKVIAIHATDGLPPIPGITYQPRLDYMIPTPHTDEVQDTTNIRKDFEFPLP